MFRVQQTACATCIYKPGSPLDLAKLEADIADRHGGFRGHRICHHSDDACCAGFWALHKDAFPLGQVAQRLRMVEFVHDDKYSDRPPPAPDDDTPAPAEAVRP